MSKPEKNSGLNAEQMRKVTENNSGTMDEFWDDPRRVMNLIDLLFLFDDPERRHICS